MTPALFVAVILIFGAAVALRQDSLLGKLLAFLVATYSVVYVVFQTPIAQLYIRIDELVFFAVILVLFLRRQIVSVLRVADVRLRCFLVTACLTSCVAYVFYGVTLYTFFIFGGMLKLYVSYCLGKAYSGRRSSVYAIVVFASGILVLVGYLQIIGALPQYEFFDAYHERRLFEVTSLLGSNPAHFGLFMTLGLYCGARLLSYRWNSADSRYLAASRLYGRRRSALGRTASGLTRVGAFAVLSITLAAGALMSDSRSSVIAILLCFVLITFFERNYRLLWIVGFVFIAWHANDLLHSALGDRTLLQIWNDWQTDSRIGSAMHRATILENAFGFLENHPMVLVTGIGYGNWWSVLTGYAEASSAHDAYLNLFMETGLVGLGFFTAFLLSICRRLVLARHPGIALLAPVMLVSFFGDFFLPMQTLEHLSFLLFFLLGMAETESALGHQQKRASSTFPHSMALPQPPGSAWPRSHGSGAA